MERSLERPELSPRDDDREQGREADCKEASDGGSGGTASREADRDSPDPRADGDGPITRRGLLAAAGTGAVAGLAGCSIPLLGGGSEPSDDAATPSGTPPSDTTEADVTGLLVESSGSTYTFSVTLDAAKSPGGATWWQVESLSGDRIHRHGFDGLASGRAKSSGQFELPDDVDGVVVRARGRYSGYGGRAILLKPGPGDIVLERQGDEPSSFEDYTF